VLDARGNTIPSAIVTVWPPGIEGAGDPRQADAGGRYGIHLQKPGNYRLEAIASGYAPTSQWVKVSKGRTAVLDFALREGVALAFELTLYGKVPGGDRFGVVYDEIGDNPEDTFYLDESHTFCEWDDPDDAETPPLDKRCMGGGKVYTARVIVPKDALLSYMFTWISHCPNAKGGLHGHFGGQITTGQVGVFDDTTVSADFTYEPGDGDQMKEMADSRRSTCGV
jgi:hypothetical protein